MYKCKCGEEDDIILQEWMGAYDGCMALKCLKCKEDYHLRTGFKILKSRQLPDYGDVCFLLENPETKFPMRFINQFLYDKPKLSIDKVFEKLEEELIL